MKRFLLIFLLTTKLFSQDVPLAIKEEIATWVESTHPTSIFGAETTKSIYEDEIESYKWIQIYALDLDILEQVKEKFPPQKLGYRILKSMYEIQIKQENM